MQRSARPWTNSKGDRPRNRCRHQPSDGPAGRSAKRRRVDESEAMESGRSQLRRVPLPTGSPKFVALDIERPAPACVPLEELIGECTPIRSESSSRPNHDRLGKTIHLDVASPVAIDVIWRERVKHKRPAWSQGSPRPAKKGGYGDP